MYVWFDEMFLVGIFKSGSHWDENAAKIQL